MATLDRIQVINAVENNSFKIQIVHVYSIISCHSIRIVLCEYLVIRVKVQDRACSRAGRMRMEVCAIVTAGLCFRLLLKSSNQYLSTTKTLPLSPSRYLLLCGISSHSSPSLIVHVCPLKGE